MANTYCARIRLDAGQNDNWCTDAAPVAVLNLASTLHERIAYCWGMANDLKELSSLLINQDDPAVSRLAALFLNQIKPLVVVLECLGTDTRLSEQQNGGAA